MKIPSTLWAPMGAVTVLVAPERLFNDKKDELDGIYDPQTRKITLSPKLNGSLLRETLDHEWLHAVLWDTGADAVLSNMAHEWVCQVVAKALAVRGGRR